MSAKRMGSALQFIQSDFSECPDVSKEDEHGSIDDPE